jgi:arylsulfatase A-like enzyme
VSHARAAAAGALGGALASLGLYAHDLASLGRLSVAGVSDAVAQERLLALTLPSVMALEARLLLLHACAGLLAGALAGLAVGGGRARRVLLGAVVTLALFVLAWLGMMGRYPQLYADGYWLAGGWRAGVQRLASHVVGPRVVDALLLAALGALVARAALVLRAPLRRVPWRAAAAAAAGLLLGVLVLRATGRAPGPPAGKQPPNVLLLVVDSLRTDRIESPDVMPVASSLAGRGTLYRHAFTPLARTVPSWVSLLTGMEPRHTGVRTMFPALGPRDDLGATFVSELRDRGFRTFVVSDFAGDMFPRLAAGFDTTDAPALTADRLARSTVLAAHGWALPFLRVAPLRAVFDEWRNLASLSDPEWLVDRTLAHLQRARGRPFLGAVFFGTPHFPYVAPWPDYLWRAGGYRGPYLYHAPPALGERELSSEDVEQVRARYDGALRATDRAIGRLIEALREDGALASTLLVVTSDHGEELYEEPGIAGHGDTIGGLRSQAVPVLLVGPGVEAGRVRSDQVRLHDLGATLLGIVEGREGRRFGDGVDLRLSGVPRPACVETGIWFFPGLPRGLEGRRLHYPGIADLIALDARTGALVLRPEWVPGVESMKARGLVLGRRVFREQLVPKGRRTELEELPGVEPSCEAADLEALFEVLCVEGDRALARRLGAVAWAGEPGDAPGAPAPAGDLSGCSPTRAAPGPSR